MYQSELNNQIPGVLEYKVAKIQIHCRLLLPSGRLPTNIGKVRKDLATGLHENLAGLSVWLLEDWGMWQLPRNCCMPC